ncbi:MAG: ATP synthase F1 subunit epsilon [Candidatus Marinimicrobia bacterium]|nr:ATP synthase F1 subunit epsilon [Candidatus Neomarinimicrobiota bacterium]
MSTFQLEIVTPTKTLDQGGVSYVRCPGTKGLFGVMGGHTEALFALAVGEIKVTKDGNTSYLSTSGGYAEVTREKVSLLLETVEEAREIDASRAQEASDRAKARLSKKEGDEVRARESLFRAVNRLKVSSR